MQMRCQPNPGHEIRVLPCQGEHEALQLTRVPAEHEEAVGVGEAVGAAPSITSSSATARFTRM